MKELVRPEGADLVQPWLPHIGENDLSGYEVETYIPVSALLSDEVVEAVAKFFSPAAPREARLKAARQVLQDVRKQVGGGQVA